VRLAAVLTVLEAALLLDAVFNGGWRVHSFLDNEAIARNVYDQRFGPQHVALVFLAIAVAAGIGLTLRLFRGRPGASLAACGCILSLCFWCLEVVSLHAVDALLYRRVNGVMLVRLIWAACSLMTSLGILWDTFAARAHDRSDK